MADEHTQRLLDAEQKARELVDTLGRLTREIDSYRSAQQELRSVGGRLSTAATALEALATQATLVIGELRKVGTPEILDSTSRVAAAIGHLSTTAEQGFRETRAAVLDGEEERCWLPRPRR